MAGQLALAVDGATGALLVEGPDHLPRGLRDALDRLAGPGRLIACAAPPAVRTLAPAMADELAGGTCVRIAGYWLGSLIEGPGRRSVAKLQGCPLRCCGFIYSADGSVSS